MTRVLKFYAHFSPYYFGFRSYVEIRVALAGIFFHYISFIVRNWIILDVSPAAIRILPVSGLDVVMAYNFTFRLHLVGFHSCN